MNKTIEKIVSLCKRRGFIFQSSDIYGGFSAIYDYGPLGVELKNKIAQLWWKEMTQVHENIVGLDSGILMHPKIWEASGHVNAFHDPLVDCKHCNSRYRADEFSDDIENIHWKEIQCPVPFGIAQIGKAFRNEIVARNFIFRTREFEQMEMQYFVKPGTDDDVLEEWKEKRFHFYPDVLGINENKIRYRQHGDNELAHYAKEAWDVEYEFPFGWAEIEGIHNRKDFDLSQHQDFSGKNLAYFDQPNNDRFLPYIIETSAGLNRMLLAVLADAYWEDEENNRVVMKLHPRLAPMEAVICPLVKKDGLPEKAREIVDMLKPHFKVLYDQQGSIGKRYYRQDEDDTVTIRQRDTQQQDRVAVESIIQKLIELTNNWPD